MRINKIKEISIEQKIINTFNSIIQPIFDEVFIYLTEHQKEVIQRQSKIKLYELMYYMCRVNTTKLSYESVINQCVDCLLIEKRLDEKIITESAVIKKKNSIPAVFFAKLNQHILDKIYEIEENSSKNDYRLLGGDGTIVYIDESFKKNGVTLSNNNHCCKLLITSFYDVERKIPINYNPSKKYDEIGSTKEQIKYLKENDIVIHDRKIYSAELVSLYNDNGVKIIVRMVKTHGLSKKIKKSKKNELFEQITYNGKKIDIRILKYKVRDTHGVFRNYFVATTLMDNIKFNIEFIKEAYHKRWQIEIHFKQLKEETTLTNFKAKTYEAIELDLQIIHFMNILNSFIKYTIEKHLLIDPYLNQINYKNCFNLVKCSLLDELFVNKKRTNPHMTIRLIAQTTNEIKSNRRYDRLRKKPVGKWRISGSTSGRQQREKEIKEQKELKKQRQKIIADFFIGVAIKLENYNYSENSKIIQKG